MNSCGKLDVRNRKEVWDDVFIGEEVGDQPMLVSMAFSMNSEFLYDVPLMSLLDEEIVLDAGRFNRFRRDEKFTNQIILPYYPPKPFTFFEEVVDWIADNLTQAWSVCVLHWHVSSLQLCFTFESHVDAVHFALRWG